MNQPPRDWCLIGRNMSSTLCGATFPSRTVCREVTSGHLTSTVPVPDVIPLPGTSQSHTLSVACSHGIHSPASCDQTARWSCARCDAPDDVLSLSSTFDKFFQRYDFNTADIPQAETNVTITERSWTAAGEPSDVFYRYSTSGSLQNPRHFLQSHGASSDDVEEGESDAETAQVSWTADLSDQVFSPSSAAHSSQSCRKVFQRCQPDAEEFWKARSMAETAQRSREADHPPEDVFPLYSMTGTSLSLGKFSPGLASSAAELQRAESNAGLTQWSCLPAGVPDDVVSFTSAAGRLQGFRHFIQTNESDGGNIQTTEHKYREAAAQTSSTTTDAPDDVFFQFTTAGSPRGFRKLFQTQKCDAGYAETVSADHQDPQPHAAYPLSALGTSEERYTRQSNGMGTPGSPSLSSVSAPRWPSQVPRQQATKHFAGAQLHVQRRPCFRSSHEDLDITSPAPSGAACVVCDGRASGRYFGAMVCLPCKSFYIRFTKRSHPVVRLGCKGQCPIANAGRSRCPVCRYQKCLSAGMCRQERPESMTATEDQELCAVCGDLANGVHFGVSSCEGCKKFFRRSLAGHATFICNLSEKCHINPRQRTNCRYCRFQKCLSVGMSLRAVRRGRRQRCHKLRSPAKEEQRRCDPEDPVVHSTTASSGDVSPRGQRTEQMDTGNFRAFSEDQLDALCDEAGESSAESAVSSSVDCAFPDGSHSGPLMLRNLWAPLCRP